MRLAKCHPDRRYHAKGMCRYCYLKAWAAANRDHVREQSRRYVESDGARERRNARKRDRHFMVEYGLTAAEIDRMTEEQGGVCRICGDPPTQGVFGRPPRLHVDHDHSTGRVRGLICSRCNTGIGQMKDSPVRLLAAIEYLCVGEVA